MRTTKDKWSKECKRYIATDNRVGLWPWRDSLVVWLEQEGELKAAQRVRKIQLEFMEDTDLGWAFASQTEGLREIAELLAVLELKHRRIFLSHKTADKQLVREYHMTLQSLGYDSWLDEDAMAAGTPLDRALLDGMINSMAAIFFITPSFTDDGYLATEIDYAVAEKNRRGDDFAIVTLMFAEEGQPEPSIPDLLRRFVWKRPKTQLEGLRQILRALPAGST